MNDENVDVKNDSADPNWAGPLKYQGWLKTPFRAILVDYGKEGDWDVFVEKISQEFPVAAIRTITNALGIAKKDKNANVPSISSSELDFEKIDKLSDELIEKFPLQMGYTVLSNMKRVNPKNRRDAILGVYDSFIEYISKQVIEHGKSLLLRGFFHSENCFSYWERRHRGERTERTVDKITHSKEKYANQLNINPKHLIQIYVFIPVNESIFDENSDRWKELLRKMNEEIRRNVSGCLFSEYEIKSRGLLQVTGFKEFSFMVLKDGESESEIQISADLPGLETLLTSVPEVISIQNHIDEQFHSAVNKGWEAADGNS